MCPTDVKLLCGNINDGTMVASTIASPQEGIEIITVAMGTPDKFTGSSTLRRLPPLGGHGRLRNILNNFHYLLEGLSRKDSVVTTPVDSRNLGQDSVAGKAADLGKRQLQKCLARMPQA